MTMAWPRAPRLAGLALAIACSAGEGEPHGARDTAAGTPPGASRPATLLADSAAGDSAAFAALPPSLRSVLDVRRMLAPDVLADTARAYCQPLGSDSGAYRRRRLRFRLPDTVGVLFVRADGATGALQRVELVRRPLTTKLQQGFSWDASDDVTREVNWTADEPTAVESGPLPRGGPAPRALRALGRQLLVVPCTGVRRP